MEPRFVRLLTLLLILLLAAANLRPANIAWAQQHITIGTPGLIASSSDELPLDEEHLRHNERLLGPTFGRTETTHFVILSDCDRDWTLARAGLLERTWHQYNRIARRLGITTHRPGHKLLCILFNDHDAYEAFAGTHDRVEAHWVAGYYASESNRMVFYNDESSPGYEQALEQLEQYRELSRETRKRAREAAQESNQLIAAQLDEHADLIDAQLTAERSRLGAQVAATAISKTIHEAIHMIAFNTGMQSRAHQYPFWLTEGLAACFETDDPRNAFGPDHPSERRELRFDEMLESDRLLPLVDLIDLPHAPHDDENVADVMYHQSYALFRWLFRYERRALSRHFEMIATQPPGAITAERQREIFIYCYGPVEDFERRWLRDEEHQLDD